MTPPPSLPSPSLQDEAAIRNMLAEEGQEHLLPLLASSEFQSSILPALQQLETTLPRGGIRRYIETSRVLLEAAAEGRSALPPCRNISPASGVQLEPGSAEFDAMDALGVKLFQTSQCACILVAGGLGERLGYPGIKLELPVETASTPSQPSPSSSYCCFLEYYCRAIQRLQRTASDAISSTAIPNPPSGDIDDHPPVIPLMIMTSDDTHEATMALLAAHNNFGMAEGQIILQKQEKVPCFSDIKARLSLSRGTIEMKPHGHGDVHTLLHKSGLADRWLAEGRRWLLFFQVGCKGG